MFRKDLFLRYEEFPLFDIPVLFTLIGCFLLSLGTCGSGCLILRRDSSAPALTIVCAGAWVVLLTSVALAFYRLEKPWEGYVVLGGIAAYWLACVIIVQASRRRPSSSS